MNLANIVASSMRFARETFRATTPTDKPTRAPAATVGTSMIETLGVTTITPSMLAIAKEAAGQGQPRDQALAYQEIQDREPLIAAHLATRKNAVLGCEWKVTSKKYPDRAKEIAAAFEKLDMRGLLAHLWDAVPTGYAGAVMDWAEGGKAINAWSPVMPWAWEFDQSGAPAVLNHMNQPHAIADPDMFPPGQLVYTAATAKPGIAPRNGLLRSLCWLHLVKQSTVTNWAKYVERFGIPMALLTMQKSTGGANEDAAVNAVLNQFRKVGANAVVAALGEAKAEFANGASAANNDAFLSLCKYADEIFAMLILGQIASSGPSGGMSKGDAQSAVRQDILESDAHLLIAAINRALVANYCRCKWGMDTPDDIYFWINYEPAEDLDKKATTLKTLSEATGRKVDADQVTEDFGVRFGDDLNPSSAPAAPGKPGTAQVALSDTGRPAGAGADVLGAALAGITRQALLRTIENKQVLAEWLGPVEAAAQAAFSDLGETATIEQFRARLLAFMAALPGLLNEMDSAKFEANLSGAMLSAVINGQLAGSKRK